MQKQKDPAHPQLAYVLSTWVWQITAYESQVGPLPVFAEIVLLEYSNTYYVLSLAALMLQ